MPGKIEDYALIGDCETAALVDRNGSIDWLCWPHFSSEACFASLLGTEDNGYWKISCCDCEWTSTRRYRNHTLILETTFEHAQGSIRLIDFMPIREKFSDVVRIVQGVRGHLDVRMELALRFDYGRTVPWVTPSTMASAPSPAQTSPSCTRPSPSTAKISRPWPTSPSTEAIASGSR